MDQLLKQVNKGDVTAVIAMIAKKAHSTFDKLPRHVQTWYTREDLIQEGVNLTTTHVNKMYRNRRLEEDAEAKFITYLFRALDNHYKDVLAEVYANKRKCLAVYSINSTRVKGTGGDFNKGQMLSDFLIEFRKIRRDIEMMLITRVDAEVAFLRVYASASYNLRLWMIRWFLQPTVTRFQLDGISFKEARKELRSIKAKEPLSRFQIEFIHRDELCRKNIATSLVRKYRTAKNPETNNLRDCLEWQLVKLAAKPPAMQAVSYRYRPKRVFC